MDNDYLWSDVDHYAQRNRSANSSLDYLSLSVLSEPNGEFTARSMLFFEHRALLHWLTKTNSSCIWSAQKRNKQNSRREGEMPDERASTWSSSFLHVVRLIIVRCLERNTIYHHVKDSFCVSLQVKWKFFSETNKHRSTTPEKVNSPASSMCKHHSRKSNTCRTWPRRGKTRRK